MPSVDDTVYRYFNDYLQTEGIRTADTDINTAIYEALGDAGYTGHLVERAQQAVGATLAKSGGFYHWVYQIASAGLLAPLPSNLGSSLLAWWDPSDLDTLFQDSTGTTPVASANDPVGLMQDKSGNARHYSQATAGSRALWDGVNALLYDGTADCLEIATQPFPAGANPSGIWAVVRQDALAADTGNRTILAYGSGTSARIRNLRRVVVTGTNSLGVAIGDGSASQTATEATVDFSGVHVVRMAVGATSTSFWIDDVAGTPLVVIPNTGSTRSRIGAVDGTSATAFWNGKIGPVVITDALTDLEVRTLELYFESITLT